MILKRQSQPNIFCANHKKGHYRNRGRTFFHLCVTLHLQFIKQININQHFTKTDTPYDTLAYRVKPRSGGWVADGAVTFLYPVLARTGGWVDEADGIIQEEADLY